MSEVLTPYAFITVAELAAYLDKDATAESDKLTRALNSATAWMNRRAARNLKARNYRTAVSVATTGSTATGSTLPVPTATLKAGDELLGTNITPGTLIQSIDSASQITLTKAIAGAVGSGATLTTGTKPILWDQECDSGELYFPEYPVLSGNIWAVYWVDGNGNRTAIDLSTVRVDELVGRVYLEGAYFPNGMLRLQLEFRGGFELPSATAVGHHDQCNDMKRITRRAAEVFYQDETALRGRSNEVNLGGFTARRADDAMPADIDDALRPYWNLS